MNRFYAGSGAGKVALTSGSLSYRGHEESEMGFRHILAEDCPQLQIVEQLEMMDDPDRAFEIATELLERHSDLGSGRINFDEMTGKWRSYARKIVPDGLKPVQTV